MAKKSSKSNLDDEKNDKLIIDFVGGAVGHRRKFGGGLGQDLPKAIGLHKNPNCEVVDATAGLGRDSFLLASLGAKVTMIERSKTMFDALDEAMKKASDASETHAEIISRMNLILGDAKDIIPDLNPAIIYVDPMHPERKKSALVKKELRLVRDIVGVDADSAELVQVALQNAKQRVVLKWPRKADPIADIEKPSHQILGKTLRYDVFMRF